MANKDKRVTGGVGSVPPPDAPRETAQPLKPELIQAQQRAARQNERELAPLKPPGKGPLPPAVAALIAPTAAPSTEALIADVFGPDTPVSMPVAPPMPNPILSAMPDQELVDQIEDVLPELSEEDRARMPAASDTDSPSKGLLPNLLPPTGDKFEGIDRGGFGHGGEEQSSPINGDELKELVFNLFDDLGGRIKNDMRFHMALTYPRVRLKVSVEVEGHPEDSDYAFKIEKVYVPKAGEKGGTPSEIAAQYGDRMVFVVSGVRQEFTPEGAVDSPPDALRDAVGLPKPYRQMVNGPQGTKMFVDVVSGR